MAKLNTTNFTKATRSEDVYAFVSEAVFAMSHLKKGDDVQARRAGGEAYQFAVDNQKMSLVKFSSLSSKLIPDLP